MDRQRQTGNIYIDLQLHSFITELQRHVNCCKIAVIRNNSDTQATVSKLSQIMDLFVRGGISQMSKRIYSDVQTAPNFDILLSGRVAQQGRILEV